MRSPLLADKYTSLWWRPWLRPALLGAAIVLVWCVGILGRGYWTPDEPREADIAWRMSWQTDKAVPLLAGIAFCEKPPMTYWLAAVPIRSFGPAAWAARLPNLLYAAVTALSIGLLATRSAGRLAGVVAAVALSTFLLSYQVAIWLATDAPLLAAVAVALLGTYRGFYASSRPERLRGYLLMHAALGFGFLCKSAAAWMVPVLTLGTLIVWEKRWRELLRWELYAGLLLQAAAVLAWVWCVYIGPDGAARLKIFFWNNLAGRFADIEGPSELHYAAAHRNSPGKYLIELPLYLTPWSLLAVAAARKAWLNHGRAFADVRTVRFGIAASLAPLAVLSMAATARNIYFAPALPGIALLIAWWSREIAGGADRWDVRALRATSVLLLMGSITFAVALIIVIKDKGQLNDISPSAIAVGVVGLIVAAALAVRAWIAAIDDTTTTQWLLALSFCALLIGPAAPVYRQVDVWQNLARIARGIAIDSIGKPLILMAPDETTRAIIDMYARTSVGMVPGPVDARALDELRVQTRKSPNSRVVVLLPAGGRTSAVDAEAVLPWLASVNMRVANSYALPNGRHYALLAPISN